MNYLYLFEGETERKLLEILKRSKHITGGKLQKFCLWDEGFSKIKRLIPKSAVICVVFDTDALVNIDRFTNNLGEIINCSKKVILLPQHCNLEDELIYACKKDSKIDLYMEFYDTNSLTGFKKKLLTDKSLLTTLKKNNFNVRQIWSRKSFFKSNSVVVSYSKVSVGSRFILWNKIE